MDTYHHSHTSVPAPLVIIQGVSTDLRPELYNRRLRTVKEQAFKPSDKKHNYGVQIEIDRELDVVKNDTMSRLVQLIERCNVNNKIWWPNQDSNNNNSSITNNNSSSSQIKYDGNNKTSMKQKQQIQQSRQRLLSNLSNGSNNSKGLWFNVKYVDNKYEIVVNGSKSPLSPYTKEGEFFGSLLPLEWSVKYYEYIPSVFISFYEIGANKSWDDILINEVNRVKLKFSSTMIKFVCVLIDPNLNKTDNERLQNIISRINMNSNSLFVINGLNDEISQREQTVFIRKLLLGLKQYSNDFFNLQLQKLKKREIKDDQYSEKFFSARNLIKMACFEQMKGITDYSAKLLEYAYDRLLQCLKSIDSVSQYKQYLEIKNWLDIMCIHIVRSCIVIGDANVAYRKFTFHIQKLRDLDPKHLTFDWLSIQYTWLGELLENINENIIPIESVLMPTLGLKEIRYNSYNMPQNGFNYLQAAEYRKLAIVEDEYPNDNTILLLTAALDSFNMVKLGKFSRIESSVYISLGDVYYSKQNYSMAVNNYYAGLSNYKQECCKFIVACILQKILNCYVGLSQIREAWSVYIELCFVDDFVWKKAKVLNSMKDWLAIMKEKILSLELVNDDSQSILMDDIVTNDDKLAGINNGTVAFVKEPIFDVSVGIKKYVNMMNEGIDLQLIVTHRGNEMISSLEINHLEIDFGENSEFKVIKITNDVTIKQKFVYQLTCGDSKEIIEEVSCPLIFKSIDGSINRKALIFQFHVMSNVVGKFYIPRVKMNGTLNDIKFNTVINVSDVEENRRPYWKWYKESNNEAPIVLENHFPTNSFEVLPKIPQIKCKLRYDRIGFNGRKFPILVKFINEDSDSKVKLHIDSMCALNKKYDVLVRWRDGGDSFDSDEVLGPGDEISTMCTLDIPQISGLPLNSIDETGDGDEDEWYNCFVKFNIRYDLVVDGVSIDVKKEARIRVVEMIKWHTELRADCGGDIPNIFEIDERRMLDVGANMNIPVHSRRWLFTLNLQNISFEDMNIKNCNFKIRGPKGIKFTLNPETESGDEKKDILNSMGKKKLKVWLDVMCLEKVMRSIPVEIQCNMEYTIEPMGDELQSYQLEMYKANLPHVDPRMLVIVKEEGGGKLVIRNIIENPTDRIFQYQSNLNPVSGIEIVDYVKSKQLSIMPFMKENLEFEYKIPLDVDGDLILPEFTLYDRQYQVFVKPNVADERLRFVEGQLILVKK